jgi:hypothetical protein
LTKPKEREREKRKKAEERVELQTNNTGLGQQKNQINTSQLSESIHKGGLIEAMST